ncbi:MAG: transposase [Methylococcus sp.]|nr:transposase [Methylococcus sp.]
MGSTRLKIWGESEWKVRQDGTGKIQPWRKAHLAVNGNAKDVIGMEVTTVERADAEVFKGLVDQAEGSIERIGCDGAYDTCSADEVAVSLDAR